MKFRKGKLPQFPGNLNEHVWTLEFETKKERDEGARLLKEALRRRRIDAAIEEADLRRQEEGMGYV